MTDEIEMLRGRNVHTTQIAVEAETQTDGNVFGKSSVGTMVTQSLLASSLAVLNHVMNANSDEENADTIQDDASSLHSLNVAEAEDLVIDVVSDRVRANAPFEPPAWVTSTPERQSVSDGLVEHDGSALPDELKVCVCTSTDDCIKRVV
ncbi:unnamed protein product [Echinostoma caproni]|uniref:Uncharacterized protein n=1 Tax=Echinostoma caproni TaxID=27848 RepID=A0A3P8CH33_9TREM|nr:unnamed protein product [Echinostoma caproni]